MLRFSWDAVAPWVAGKSDQELGRLFGVHPSVLPRWRRVGLTETRADLVAVKLGFAPETLWPEWTDELIRSHEVECEATDCTDRFVAGNGRRFCSDRCRNREARRRWNRNPEHRKKKREHNQRYYQECRDYLLAAERRRYYENRDRILERRRQRRKAAPVS